jgi:peptide/nickel transport system substrate-binding protein
VVTDYQPGNRIVMEANENYFIEDQPHLAGLEIIFFNDQSASADALRGGQIDLTMDLSTPLYESLRQEDGVIAQDIATNQFANVRIRVDQPPGNEPAVIQALKLATDRQEIFQLVQQGYGAVGRDSPIGPLFSDYYTEETPLPERDPERAQELLAEAGYPDGLDLDMFLLDTLNFPDLAAVLKQQWSEAGINVEINTVPESVFYGEGRWLEVTLGIVGWGHRPYPQFYLDVMLACDAKWNATRICDEELDRLIQTAGTTLDEQERIDAYREIQRILIERGPLIVPYFFAEYGVISDRFEGFQIKAFSGRTDLRQVQIAE